jgi:RNA polymerase sigma-70 factor (ECF subfamily)
LSALARTREDELRVTLETLPAAQRQVLLLRTVGNLTLEQTAEVVGRSVGAVRLLQRRAATGLCNRLAANSAPH